MSDHTQIELGDDTPVDQWDVDNRERIEALKETLPPASKEIWENAEREEITAIAERHARHRQAEKFREEIKEQAINLGSYDRHIRAGGTPDESRRAKMQKAYDAKKAQLVKLQNEKPASRFRLSTLENWAASLPPGVTLKPVKPKIDKADPVKALKRNREARANFISERDRVKTAPRPLAEAEADFLRDLDRREAEGKPAVAGLLKVRVNALTGRTETGHANYPRRYDSQKDEFVTDASKVVFWACRPQIEKSGRAQLKEAAAATEVDAIPLAARAGMLKKIEEHLLALEYEECALVAATRAAGGKAELRPDTRPECALLVEVVPAPKPEKPEGYAGKQAIVFGGGKKVKRDAGKLALASTAPDTDTEEDFG